LILAAHQPNFMPWSPFFQKIRESDIFVILEHAQYVKGNFHNRFKLGNSWYTMPVKGSFLPISQMEYASPNDSWLAIQRRLPLYREELDLFDNCIEANVAKANTKIIKRVLESQSGHWADVIVEPVSALKATARLVDLCLRFEATTYLSGPSGKKYLDEALFQQAGVELKFFEHKGEAVSLLEGLKNDLI
jgi:hypothetical protein